MNDIDISMKHKTAETRLPISLHVRFTWGDVVHAVRDRLDY